MKYRIVEVPIGGYEIEQKGMFGWINLHYGFMSRVPFKTLEEAEKEIEILLKPRKIIKIIEV